YKELANHNHVLYGYGLGNRFRDWFYDEDGNKTFPYEFFKKGYNFWRGLELGLKNSDGNERRGTEDWSYSTMSEDLANKIQAMGSIYGSTFSLRKDNRGLNILQRFSRRKEPRLNDTATNRALEIDYGGTVYCATVSTGLLIVRRNNKVVLSGNS